MKVESNALTRYYVQNQYYAQVPLHSQMITPKWVKTPLTTGELGTYDTERN